MRPTRLPSWLGPLLRTYIRYAPLRAGKATLWSRVIDPYFAWQPHPFVASTVFGMKIAGDARDIIGQYIYYFGQWEPAITRWIASRLRPGDTFVDVGAHLGYYALLAARLVGEHGQVIAIEASPKNFAALRANLARNRVGNVRPLNVAVTDRPGTVRLFAGHAHNSGLTTILADAGLEFEAEVPAAPLAALIPAAERARLRLIKIDVEGAEALVVAGMAGLLADARPELELVIEVSPERLARQGRQAEELLAPFLAAGFRPYRLDNDYAAQSYLAPPRAGTNGLRALELPIEGACDVVLSRQATAP